MLGVARKFNADAVTTNFGILLHPQFVLSGLKSPIEPYGVIGVARIAPYANFLTKWHFNLYYGAYLATVD